MGVLEYKSISSRPNAFRREVLEATERALSMRHPPSAMRLRDVLSGVPVRKPKLHQGGESSDCFIVTINVAEAEQIMEYLVDAEAESVNADCTTSGEASRIGELVGAWVRHIDFCDAAS